MSKKKQHTDPVELARLGPIAYKVKRQLKPKDWSKLVKLAHDRGFSINSFLDTSVPNAMKERTRSSLTDQATKTVAAAYAPAEQELSSREQQIKNIDALRAQDNQHYLDWLTAKTGELQTHAAVAQQQLQQAGQAIQDQTATQLAAIKPQLQQAAAAQPGQVSQASQPNATTNADVDAEAQRSLGLIAGERQRTAQMVGTQQEHSAAESANNFAIMAASEARRQAETWKSLTDVADEKSKLTLEKGAKTAEEVARLLDQEIQKAQQNRDFKTVAAQLGIKQQDADTQAANAETARINAGTAAERAKEAARHNHVSEEEARRQHQAAETLRAQANRISQGQLDVAWYRAKHPNSGHGGGSGSGTSSSDPQERFDAAYAALVSTPRTVDSKNRPVAYDAGYVRTHMNEVISTIMRATKISRELAARVVQAYIDRNGDGSDPGSYKDYQHAPAAGHDPKPGT